MKILIKKEYFEGTNYSDIYDCALAVALKNLGYSSVKVGGISVNMDGDYYKIEEEQGIESVIGDNYSRTEPIDITVTLTKK